MPPVSARAYPGVNHFPTGEDGPDAVVGQTELGERTGTLVALRGTWRPTLRLHVSAFDEAASLRQPHRLYFGVETASVECREQKLLCSPTQNTLALEKSAQMFF